MNDTHAGYNQHKQLAKDVVLLMKRGQKQLSELNMDGEAASVHDLCTRLSNDSFKILVIGEFKRGKSTFINALLREHILPSYSIPCTAVINEISHGETRSAKIFLRENLSNDNIESLPMELRQHLKKHPQPPRPPYEIPVERLEDYVVIKDHGASQAEAIAANPYERVKITWPVDLCRHGIELIDSPGLNENGTRTRVTLNYLRKADAVVFVLSCQALASESELEFIRDNLVQMGHQDIFFVANRFDEIKPRERDRVKEYAVTKLAPLTRFGAKGIFFLSAQDALEGHMEGNQSLVAQSGLPELEQSLQDYLVDNRGRAKVIQPVNQCLTYLDRALWQKIPAARAIAAQSADELKRRYDAALPPLKDARLRRDNLLRTIEADTADLRENIANKFAQRMTELADSLPDWVKTAQFQQEFGVFNGEWPKEQAERIAKEVVILATEHIKSQNQAWLKSTLSPWVASRLQRTQEQAVRDAQLFMTSLENASNTLSGLPTPLSNQGVSADAALKRILEAAAGRTLTGLGGELATALGGYEGLVSRVLPAVGAMVGLAIIGVMIPASLVAIIVGAAIAAAMGKSLQVAPQLRSRVAEEMKKNIKAGASEQANEVAKNMTAAMGEYLQLTQVGLDRELQSVQKQVDSVRQELDSGLRDSQNELAELENRADVIAAISRKMKAVLTDVGA